MSLRRGSVANGRSSPANSPITVLSISGSKTAGASEKLPNENGLIPSVLKTLSMALAFCRARMDPISGYHMYSSIRFTESSKKSLRLPAASRSHPTSCKRSSKGSRRLKCLSPRTSLSCSSCSIVPDRATNPPPAQYGLCYDRRPAINRRAERHYKSVPYSKPRASRPCHKFRPHPPLGVLGALGAQSAKFHVQQPHSVIGRG